MDAGWRGARVCGKRCRILQKPFNVNSLVGTSGSPRHAVPRTTYCAAVAKAASPRWKNSATVSNIEQTTFVSQTYPNFIPKVGRGERSPDILLVDRI
jgi:hypothetical protein